MKKLFILFIIIFVLGLFWVRFSRADVELNLVAVQGPNSLTKQEVLELFDSASRQFHLETGERLILGNFRLISNPFVRLQTNLANTLPLLNAWKGWFDRHGPRLDVNHVVLPPIKDQGIWWLAGYSSGTCNRFGTSYSNGEPRNSFNLDRHEQSRIAFLHEALGHICGASHDSGINIMNPAPLPLVRGRNLHFSESSINQIRRCSGRW